MTVVASIEYSSQSTFLEVYSFGEDINFPKPIFHMSNEDEPGHNKVSLDNLMEENVLLALWKIWGPSEQS